MKVNAVSSIGWSPARSRRDFSTPGSKRARRFSAAVSGTVYLQNQGLLRRGGAEHCRSVPSIGVGRSSRAVDAEDRRRRLRPANQGRQADSHGQDEIVMLAHTGLEGVPAGCTDRTFRRKISSSAAMRAASTRSAANRSSPVWRRASRIEMRWLFGTCHRWPVAVWTSAAVIVTRTGSKLATSNRSPTASDARVVDHEQGGRGRGGGRRRSWPTAPT